MRKCFTIVKSVRGMAYDPLVAGGDLAAACVVARDIFSLLLSWYIIWQNLSHCLRAINRASLPHAHATLARRDLQEKDYG